MSVSRSRGRKHPSRAGAVVDVYSVPAVSIHMSGCLDVVELVCFGKEFYFTLVLQRWCLRVWDAMTAFKLLRVLLLSEHRQIRRGTALARKACVTRRC